MENRFLVTYSVPSTEYSGRINLFKWEDSEDDVRDFLNEKKNVYGVAFQVIEVVEIVESKLLNIKQEILDTKLYKCKDCGFVFEEYESENMECCIDCGSNNLTSPSDEEYDKFLNRNM